MDAHLWRARRGRPGGGRPQDLRRAQALPRPASVIIPAVLGQREYDPLYGAIGDRPVDPRLLYARFPATVPALSRGGGGERPQSAARRERRRLPGRAFRPYRGGSRGAIPRDQLRRLLPLFRRLWLRGSVSPAGGRREISTPHYAAAVRVDRGSLSQSQIRPSRDGGSGQTRDRSAEDA